MATEPNIISPSMLASEEHREPCKKQTHQHLGLSILEEHFY